LRMFQQLLTRKDGIDPVQEASARTTAHLLKTNERFEWFVREKIAYLEGVVASLEARGPQSGRQRRAEEAEETPAAPADWGAAGAPADETGPVAAEPEAGEAEKVSPPDEPSLPRPEPETNSDRVEPSLATTEAAPPRPELKETRSRREESAVKAMMCEPDGGGGGQSLAKIKTSTPAMTSLLTEPEPAGESRFGFDNAAAASPAVKPMLAEPAEDEVGPVPVPSPPAGPIEPEPAITGGDEPPPPESAGPDAADADEELPGWNILLTRVGPKGAHE